MSEAIKEIPLEELHPFPDHPFGVRDDEAMAQTVESIREYGVLVPAIKDDVILDGDVNLPFQTIARETTEIPVVEIMNAKENGVSFLMSMHPSHPISVPCITT